MTQKKRSLDDVLRSTSDVLFPAEMGGAAVAVDSRSTDDDTPLHVMTWRGDAAAIRMLLEAGADVNAVGDMGETPLHVALRRDDTRIVEILLDAGADTTIRSEFDKTPAEYAAKSKDMQRLFRAYAQRGNRR